MRAARVIADLPLACFPPLGGSRMRGGRQAADAAATDARRTEGAISDRGQHYAGSKTGGLRPAHKIEQDASEAAQARKQGGAGPW